MASIQAAANGRIAPVSPPGMEVTDRGYANEDLVAGDLIVISPNAAPSSVHEFSVSKATEDEAHGIMLVDCNKGGTAEFSTQNELDGYTGLTPGKALRVSATGELDDDDALTTTVVGRCVTTSRIRVVFV